MQWTIRGVFRFPHSYVFITDSSVLQRTPTGKAQKFGRIYIFLHEIDQISSAHDCVIITLEEIPLFPFEI